MILSTIIAAFLATSIASTFNSNNALPKITDCFYGANYIQNNLSYFNEQLNKEWSEDDIHFSFSSIEHRHNVDVERDGRVEKAVLLDFNEDNGYLLIADNYEILELESCGESPFLNIAADRFGYSPYGGFFYEKNGNMVAVNWQNDEEKILSSPTGRAHYNGQVDNEKGCGYIRYPDTYISSCYGNKYKLVSSKKLTMERYTQMTLSCYLTFSVQNGTTTWYSEGNCGLVSAYHALQLLQKYKWNNLPSVDQKTLYDPYLYETEIYFRRFDITGRPLYDNLQKQDNSVLEQWPVLYKETRMRCIEKFGKYDGLTVNQTSAIIESIARDYNHNVDAREDAMYKFSLDAGISELNNNKPLCFSLLGDESYGSHTVAVCGFRKYEGKKKVLFFDVNDTVVLYELADGHYSEEMYYDMSATSTLGSLVFIDFK